MGFLGPHLLFSLRKFYRFSRSEAPDGRLLPYGPDNVSIRIHPVTGWHSLLPLSHPILPTACLTVSMSGGRKHGVTPFRIIDIGDLRSILSAGGMCPCRIVCKYPNLPLTFLVQACQPLWLVNFHDSCKCSLMLTIVSYPNPSPGWGFPERVRLAAFTPYHWYFGALSGRLHTRQGCSLGACSHRVSAMER